METGKKKVKEKPSYNVWQNTCYVVEKAWKEDKVVLFVVIAQILVTVCISVVGLFLPKTVVAQITAGVPMWTLIWTIVGFTVVTTGLQAAKAYIDSTTFPRRLGRRISILTDMLKNTLTTDYANLEEKKFTDLKRKAQMTSNGNNGATEQIYAVFSSLGTSVLGFIVYIILLASVNPIILIVTAATTIFSALVRKWANRWRHDHDDEATVQDKKIWYINDISTNASYAKDIRLFAMTDWLNEVYNTASVLKFDFNRRAGIKQLMADLIDCVAAFAREGIAYGFLIWQVLSFGLSVDSFVLMFAAIGGFSGWIMGILNEYATLSRFSLDFCRIREFLGFKNKFKREDGENIEKCTEYSLELKNVSFKYSGAEVNTLENINLIIKAGEKLAVVGLNGAGKTTLVKLLCGFYDPTEGEVLLNGIDIRRYNRVQYYTLFTAVFQEFNILPITLAENVSQMNMEDVDHERLAHCLSLADIKDRVDALPKGTDSLMVKSVNDKAAELSGGETQRLMLARALYKDSPILLLDEPTAALDPIAESKLYERYNELSSGKTSVYISHRLASTRFCDRIILVGDKRIMESGTHEQLMGLNGKYTEMFEIQSKYYKEDVETETEIVA